MPRMIYSLIRDEKKRKNLRALTKRTNDVEQTKVKFLEGI